MNKLRDNWFFHTEGWRDREYDAALMFVANGISVNGGPFYGHLRQCYDPFSYDSGWDTDDYGYAIPDWEEQHYFDWFGEVPDDQDIPFDGQTHSCRESRIVNLRMRGFDPCVILGWHGSTPNHVRRIVHDCDTGRSCDFSLFGWFNHPDDCVWDGDVRDHSLRRATKRRWQTKRRVSRKLRNIARWEQ